MNKQRPAIFSPEDMTSNRMKAMNVKEQPKTDNNVIKRNIPQQVVAKEDFSKLDVDNDSQLVDWLRQHQKKEGFTYRGYTIKSIDSGSNKITLFNNKTGRTETLLLSSFLVGLRRDIKTMNGETKIDGKVVSRNDLINLIKSDISNEKLFKGKKIIAIDLATNTITLESDNFFGLPNKVSLDNFIEDYIKEREFGYGDTAGVVDKLSENTRLQNIEDMATAFRAALNIQPPKILGYSQLKDNRQLDGLSHLMVSRERSTMLSVEELNSIYKTGVIPNAPIEVSGQLMNYFNPEAPIAKPIRMNQAPQKMKFDGTNSVAL